MAYARNVTQLNLWFHLESKRGPTASGKMTEHLTTVLFQRAAENL